MKKICANCFFWDMQDVGAVKKCTRLSVIAAEETPEFTGIVAYPECEHDGKDFTYSTCSWFGCIGFQVKEEQ